VDLKEVNGKVYVIEINDNPSIDSDYEDRLLKDELYRKIMDELLHRVEQKKERSLRV
jgi:glutathione synthase/RimK-type ligase-like ATP-grasp enzyme